MKVDEKVVERLDQLIKTGNDLLRTRQQGVSKVVMFNSAYDFIDKELANQWGVSCLNILSKTFGENSDYYKRFDNLFNDLSKGTSNTAPKCLGIIKAAKDDYENGYLFNTRTLIEAEVFTDFIQQAEELLKKGYFQPAAVIAGSVLEDALRKLCQKNNIIFPNKPTIEPMNVELAKIGVYNNFIKDKVSSIGKLRNHAAHGEWDKFEKHNVEDMIRDVRRFMEDYFT